MHNLALRATPLRIDARRLRRGALAMVVVDMLVELDLIGADLCVMWTTEGVGVSVHESVGLVLV